MPKKIPLTQGKVAIVDDEDFAFLSQWKWYYAKGYAVRNIGPTNQQRQLQMHRVVMSIPKGRNIDHVNGVKLDNRRCNLRIATHPQNRYNSRPFTNSTSPYKGVALYRKTRKWRALIHYQGRAYHLGYFHSEEAAARAYDAKAKELFGEFAWLNFPDSQFTIDTPL